MNKLDVKRLTCTTRPTGFRTSPSASVSKVLFCSVRKDMLWVTDNICKFTFFGGLIVDCGGGTF